VWDDDSSSANYNLWIDTNNDGLQQTGTEPMISYRALGVAIQGTGSGRTVSFELNVPVS
jgi:hypothetical protein